MLPGAALEPSDSDDDEAAEARAEREAQRTQVDSAASTPQPVHGGAVSAIGRAGSAGCVRPEPEPSA